MPAIQRKCIYWGLTLDVDRHYIGSVTSTTHQGKRHNNTWVEPLAGNCTTSFTRQREQVWQKCKIQKNWCTVTVAPSIEHHGGHSRNPANQITICDIDEDIVLPSAKKVKTDRDENDTIQSISNMRPHWHRWNVKNELKLLYILNIVTWMTGCEEAISKKSSTRLSS